MNFKEQMAEKVAGIEEVLKAYMPKEEGPQKLIMEAMNYSVTVGGKRLRPMLMQETYRLFGGEGDVIEPFMAAQEMIHTYSLVHDDLPAMDNDEYRRGKKTTWVAYGEDMAILAGDGLLNYAFETALKAFGKGDALKVADSLKILAGKAGIYGMIGGQVVDVMSEEKKIDMETLLFIHRNKTSALIQSSMMIGAVLAGASKEDVDKIEKIGEDIGLAFQIQDDILDVTSSLEVLGKPVGSDEKNEKTTYITLEGFEKSKKDVEEISHRAIEGLKSFERENQFLNELVEMLIHREK
jgi:geranylgeranyl diphosphate synthase type II